MKVKALFFTTVALALFVPHVFGQEASPQPQEVRGVVGLPSSLSPLSGVYYGNVETGDGSGFRAFELILVQNQRTITGTSQYFKADKACRQITPVVGIIKDDGTAEIKAGGVVRGCDRTFRLETQPDKQLAGEVVGVRGGTWKFKLEKK